jgi:tetratricopeptide (TPR) repeat protein
MTPAKGPDRVPVSVKEWASRIDWKGNARNVLHSMERVAVSPRIIEDFRPLYDCLEWRLSQHYWSAAGVLPFAGNEVPFLINNSGRLSENAALLLFANCCETQPEGPITVVEFGAGTGLFARYFLDTFEAVCEQEGRDFYSRLRYVVTDRSPATLEHWGERGLFTSHMDRVFPRVCAAENLTASIQGTAQAVFCNYVLDVLPCAIVRRSSDGEAEQLCIRTHFTDEVETARNYTTMSVEEIRDLVETGELQQILPLISLLDYEVAFRTDGASALPYVQPALDWKPDLKRILLNFGAITCLEQCLDLLAADGFILVNDYGPVDADQVAEHSTAQRFGITTALGLNFPFLEHYFAQAGSHVRKPSGDDSRSLHARLITRSDVPSTAEAFENRFAADAYAYFEAPIDQARKHAAAGRKGEALEAYRTALTLSPRDWTLVGEVAEFVSSQLRDHASAVELCRAAVDMNPFYSAWLWNVLGDALYCLEKYGDAHEAYLQAERIDPNDLRTNLNLSYTYLQSGKYTEALQVICRGLQADARGLYRDRFLEKQHQVLSAVSARWFGEQDRLGRRNQRFSAS